MKYSEAFPTPTSGCCHTHDEWVTLNADEIREAEVEAKLRNDQANLRHYKNRVVLKHMTDYDGHFVGCCGERAFCKIMGWPWKSTAGKFHFADHEDERIEVRTRTKQWYDLKIRPDDGDNWRMVLVLMDAPTKPFRFAGWINAAEGKRHPTIDPNNSGKPFHAVPQNCLKPLSELRELLAYEL